MRLARSLFDVLRALLFAAIAVGSGTAMADSFPARPVKIIVGQSAGGGPDKLARILAEQLSQMWQQPVIVENRPGVGGSIAAELVAKAQPDGYTLLLGQQSSLAVAAATSPALRYDPLTDFAPIGRIANVPVFVVVNAAVPAKTIPELLSYGRAHPGRLTVVSYGDTTASALAFQRFMDATGVDLVEIYYSASATAKADLLAGRVDLAVQTFSESQQHVDSGRLRILGAAGSRRAPFAPEIPTLAEQGLPGFKLEMWHGLVAPAGVPGDVFARLRDALTQIQQTPGMRSRIEQLDYEPVVDDTAQFAAIIRSDIDEFSKLAKRKQASASRK